MNRSFATIALLIAAVQGCARHPLEPGLIPTSSMGTIRGMHFARIITHFHIPYSFDACDGKGLSNGSSGDPADWCVADIRQALCDNHIDYAFVTDHPNNMSYMTFQQLVLQGPGDTIVNGAYGPIANQMYCSNGHVPTLVPGLEGRFLALGMQQHVPGLTGAQLNDLYNKEDAATMATLQDPAGANALVVIPHTESRDPSLLMTLNPAAIEIYNVHANLDPRIRKTYLGLPPFDHIGKFLNYLVDPTNSLNADYLFMEFLAFCPVYFNIWNNMLAAGLHTTGLGGLDSHENIFPEKGSDGLRLDHHRRMTRFMNNWVLTTGTDIDSIKNSIKAGLLYFIVEGLGTPIGLDYYGSTGGTTTEMGSTMTVTSPATSSLTFNIPHVDPNFAGMDGPYHPVIYAELHKIDSAGAETVVAVSTASQLIYANPTAGNYRVHVFMFPVHLHDLIYDQNLSLTPYQWIISNPIKVVTI